MDRVVPGRDAEVLDWLAFEQSGVLTSDQAVRAIGCGNVRGRIKSGRWRRICCGVLCTHNGRLERDQQLWVAVLASGSDALLAGATAAAESGIRGLRPEPIHILIPTGRRKSTRLPVMPIDMPGVRVSRTATLPPHHRQLGRPPRTTIARAVVDAAAWARTDDEARAVLATACQQRRVMPDEIREVLSVFPTIRRRELIRVTTDDIAGGAEALSEIDFVRLCRRFELPTPELQERRRDAEGRNRYLDAYWRRYRLHAEVDGAHHLDVRLWAADMRRQNEIWIAGDRILRFPAYVVRARPAEVARHLTAALRAGGWQGILES